MLNLSIKIQLLILCGLSLKKIYYVPLSWGWKGSVQMFQNLITLIQNIFVETVKYTTNTWKIIKTEISGVRLEK